MVLRRAGAHAQPGRPALSPLEEYRRKRDPARTPEPFGAGDGADARALSFVIHRHSARRLHYDLRLERDGALMSWAVPKGPPLAPGDRHLAVHVEDHPLEYRDFEGTIPAGEYGAGTIEIWDRGSYELVEDKKDGGMTVRLRGARLRGLWTLVPAHMGGEEKNWLLMRKPDPEGDAPPAPAGRDEHPSPMLAASAQEPPAGAGWVFEVKWDGYRAVSRLVAGEVRMWSRTGQDLTERFADIVRVLPRALRSPDCVVDGEVCALDDRGMPSFGLMQRGGGTLRYYLFDALEVDGESLTALPLSQRRRRLTELVDTRVDGVAISEQFTDGAALYDAANRQGLEGIMAKRLDSPYRPGTRAPDWRKIKVRESETFPIVGYTRGKSSRARFGALVLGMPGEDGLEWAGNVGTGFTQKEIDRLLGLLGALERDSSPLTTVPKMPRVKASDVTWVEPRLRAEVEFAELTEDRRLRAPAYLGLRDDVHAETAPAPVRAAPKQGKAPAAGSRARTETIVKGDRSLKLGNLDKPFFPSEGIVKGDLIDYYRAVADVLVPHLRDRPFTMKRYPDGAEAPFFFQKDAPGHMPEWIPTREFEASTRDTPRRRRLIRFPLVNDELALLWMVNMGCIDMNAWYSRVDMPERPDFVLFDLDPAEDVGFRETVQVAHLVREALDLIGLEGYPKTSGGKGIHVLVPIVRKHDFEQTRTLSEVVAGALARTNRGLVTTEWVKAKRRGVLIDANQNGFGKTISSVYSVRPRPGAPVSTPLRWEELTEDLDPRDFTMDVVRERVRREGDLLEPVLHGRQGIATALKALRG